MSDPLCDIPNDDNQVVSDRENRQIKRNIWTQKDVAVAKPYHTKLFKRKEKSFCSCLKLGKEKECVCGEDDLCFEWSWDDSSKSSSCVLSENKRQAYFHMDYSCGTAAVRGCHPIKDNQYFWEIKMTSPVYGTDMMVGVGTEHTSLDKYTHSFRSLLGSDGESWGLSYYGTLHHGGIQYSYATKFGQGSIIGVHLDMWHGTLSFYKNRIPLGIAFRGLQGKTVYPIVSSTAATSGMKIISSRSFPTCLQFMCCEALRKAVPPHISVLDAVPFPPGLHSSLSQNINWLLQSCLQSEGHQGKRFHPDEDGDSSRDDHCSKRRKS